MEKHFNYLSCGPQGLAEFRLAPGTEDMNATNNILVCVTPNAPTATKPGCYVLLQLMVEPLLPTGELLD